jgi:2-oxoglutarate ferredoxin oxidoreductase subunit alpha
MRSTILFGGKAGQGPNVIAEIIGKILVNQGYYVFMSREYASVIRGGHNYNLLTFSEEPTFSNDTEIDIIIALDENTINLHQKNLKKTGILLKDHTENMFYAGALIKILNLERKYLEAELKEMKNFETNLASAKEGYSQAKEKLTFPKPKKSSRRFMSGSQSTAQGAIKSGLDLYFAYPMTPATPLLFELAPKQIEHNYFTLELENEIAVINAAIGAAITGAKAMAGTSGGGFDLMTEALSFAGQAEVPLVLYNAQRPGPGTGVPTATAQGDLNMVRHSGHGDFPRIVLAPGDITECEELTSQCFYFSQKLKIPCILLTDKHLSESFFTSEDIPKITKSEKLATLKRYNSYEHDENGNVVETPEAIEKEITKRINKFSLVNKEISKFQQFKVFGKKTSKNIIISWGSNKGVILDCIQDLDVKFIHITHLVPFAEGLEKELKDKNIIAIENNSHSHLAELISENTGLEINKHILKYNGLPFYANELKKEIKRILK